MSTEEPRGPRTIYPGPPTNPPPAPQIPAVDWRDLKSLRNDVLDFREALQEQIDANNDAAIARAAKADERLEAIERIARATFEELTGRDAASIPGVQRDWTRFLRLVVAAAVVVALSVVTACATVRVVAPAPVPVREFQP